MPTSKNERNEAPDFTKREQTAAERRWIGSRRKTARKQTMFTFDAPKLQAELGNLYAKLVSITRIADHAGPLMESWERIMVQDNLDGVLAGTDKDGNPRTAQLSAAQIRREAADRRTTPGPASRARRGLPAGLGNLVFRQYGLLANNNLATSEYRRLDGPRLAPRWAVLAGYHQSQERLRPAGLG